MAKVKEKTPLTKKGWTANFTLVGEAKVGDYTFSLDNHSEKSDWVYNRMSLGVDCGEKYGTVFAELMGGFGSERGDKNIIYVHGKKEEDGSDDFDNQYTIHWDDRLDEDILADIGSLCFLTVGLEKDVKDKTVYKQFLSAYDAIAYIQEHLTDGMVVNVKGQLKYSVYNDTIQCKKEINSIALSSATPDKYRASFIQTMWLDKDSCTKDSVDKDKSVLNIFAYVAEKFKEYNGYDLTDGGKNKGGLVVPLRKTFEYPIDVTNGDLVQKIMNKVFKVKKGVTQITFEGEFVESGAAVTATMDDVPEEIKELIEMGMYTEEEALAKCSENGNKERRMILTRPVFRMVGEEDNKVPQILREDEKYTEDDLLLDCLVKKDEDEEEYEEEVDETIDESDDDSASVNDMSWLDNLE